MVKLTTMAMVTIIKDIQEVCLIESWSSAKVTMRSCFLFENSALDQIFKIMFFVFHHVLSEDQMICAGMNLCSYLTGDVLHFKPVGIL